MSGLDAALAYIPAWLAFQLRQGEFPGCAVAVAKHGEVVFEAALGSAALGTGEAFTPRHRFRVASHSKTFTAAGILRLREQGRLGLDDAAGKHVAGLHPDIAATPLSLLLSHGAGIIRNGPDGGYFSDLRAYPDAAEITADLAAPPVLPAETRFKYSNHGYALLGLVIEAVTGERYADWMAREIVAPFGLHDTVPDLPLAPGTPFARGHTQKLPLGERLVIPGDNPTRAYASAAGFASTAGDLARFFAQLSPLAAQSPLSPASRRALAHRQWRNLHTPFEVHYGYGTISGTLNGWDWFGHSGALQGYASRTAVVPEQGLAVSLLINAVAAPADPMVDGLLHILRAGITRGEPQAALADWHGRWWSLWGAVDLLPLGDRVLVGVPAFWNPVGNVSEIALEGPDTGRIVLANGYGNPGEAVRLERDADGQVVALDVAGARLLPEAAHAAALRARYGGV